MAQQPKVLISRLLVSSYSGNISTVELSIAPHVPRPAFKNLAASETVLTASNGLASLNVTDSVQGCGSKPAWMIYERPLLYCLDEAENQEQGVLAVFNVDDHSKLASVRNHRIRPGAVSGVLHHTDDESTLFIAHYRYA
jgi:hypothetical protein